MSKLRDLARVIGSFSGSIGRERITVKARGLSILVLIALILAVVIGLIEQPVLGVDR